MHWGNCMNKKKTVFQQKLQTYSKSTIQKISDLATSEQALEKVVKIVEESKTEQEVVEKLNSL